LIEAIPDEIPIPGSDNYIQGGISGELGAHNNSYMEIPVDASLQNTKHPLMKPNDAAFGHYINQGY